MGADFMIFLCTHIPCHMTNNLFRSLMLALLITGLTAFSPACFKKAGITGYLYKVSGNQMPSPDIKPASPKGVKGTLYIYELTNTSQAVLIPGSSFYSSISTKLVKEIETGDAGYFNVKLPPGKYSVFIKKDTVLYANRFDDKNNIAPVEVKRGKKTKMEVRLDYDAVY